PAGRDACEPAGRRAVSEAGSFRPGPLALIGGGEWDEGCTVDADLLEWSGGEALVLPTAAAYEHPERVVAEAERGLGRLGARVRGLMVLRRPDALEQANAEAITASRLVYLAGGSPLHLRSVLKGSVVWEALVAAWRSGTAVAGSSAGAMVLTDPMVDPRGGAFTVGLALVQQLAVIPEFGEWSEEKLHRTLALAPPGLAVAGIDRETALVRDPDGAWRVAGAGGVRVFCDGSASDLRALP
ncbi:MAG: Type 1 glutamine amidotransferase-like domain-containing protein, partial [Acidimicrobiales bacterium]|nr:Type 1 glutamine amidotransferase-like domain-containing protein [Acidimicrobiales bacterium]